MVILDLVRSSCSSPFLEDPHRLNVALTRARACELVVMQPGMRRVRRDNTLAAARNMTALWDHCASRGLICEM